MGPPAVSIYRRGLGMGPWAYRILSFAWSAALCAYFALQMHDPAPSTILCLGFAGTYVGVTLGTFFDLRSAWAASIMLTFAAWLFFGVLVSDRSFEVFVGNTSLQDAHSINQVIVNSYFGILWPSTLLMVLLFCVRDHVRWVFLHRWRAIGRPDGARRVARRRPSALRWR